MQPNILDSYKGIIDSTLREGLQYRFANFTTEEQKHIVSLLRQVGVDRIEVGNPVNDTVKHVMRDLVRIKNRPKLLSHIRNRSGDLQEALSSGVDGVNILCTVDSRRLEHMRCSFEKYMETLRKNILSAKEKRLEVRVSVEDFFRSDRKYSMEIYKQADMLRVNRIGIADTLGIAMSWEVEQTVGIVKKICAAEIEVHFHNDLGLANNNAIAAIRGGAHWVDTTLLGIGERSGITPLSTFLISLYHLNPTITSRYRLHMLTEAENTVAGMLGKDVPFNLLTNRDNGFSHKAGIHLHALTHFGPNTYEAIAPHVIGNTRHLVHDSTISGKTTLKDVKRFHTLYGEEKA